MHVALIPHTCMGTRGTVFILLFSQLLVNQALLIIKASRSHSDTPHSVGLLWTGDQLVAQTSTSQHTTLTRDRHPSPRRDLNRKF